MADIAFRLTFNIKVLKKILTGQFDIETAFLHSELDKEIYKKFLMDMSSTVHVRITQC
jgi:ribosomal protein L31E